MNYTRVAAHKPISVKDRCNFMLTLPRNAGIAVLPHRFYCHYQQRLGAQLLFVDAQGDSNRLTLHKGTFAGTMGFYRITDGETIHDKYVGYNIFLELGRCAWIWSVWFL
ncbi:hypothetical protein PIB30_047372 [Stylosanthes scabra]|uniref:Uncharacterized protein n=1 Tax=Stylosanthes scabra TaxID=79078 RepID=A0ABU6WF75_9FABA|nr:hypothetical protein [Stylosanthes scabra]